MADYAIVDSTGTVVNVAVWDGVTPWEPPEGTPQLIPDGVFAGIGWTFSNGTFTPPPEPQG